MPDLSQNETSPDFAHALYERLENIRRYAQQALDQVIDPNAAGYEPGDENHADMLISARFVLTLCDGKNA